MRINKYAVAIDVLYRSNFARHPLTSAELLVRANYRSAHTKEELENVVICTMAPIMVSNCFQKWNLTPLMGWHSENYSQASTINAKEMFFNAHKIKRGWKSFFIICHWWDQSSATQSKSICICMPSSLSFLHSLNFMYF